MALYKCTLNKRRRNSFAGTIDDYHLLPLVTIIFVTKLGVVPSEGRTVGVPHLENARFVHS